MNDIENNNFKLTDRESKKAMSDATVTALYLLLAAIVLITAGHGVMLVMLTSETLAIGGLTGTILNIIRVTFPVITEWGAVVAGLGFINARWRKGQKTVALLIEVVWVLFAAANMITVFAIERSQDLQTWQQSWISYGLPMSALIQAILVYALKRTDPDNKRLNEEAAALEEMRMNRFSARRDVALSEQMKAIEKQKQWLEFVNELRAKGYSEAQIRFILADTPQLLVDGNSNGTPDLLESPPTPSSQAQPAKPGVSAATQGAVYPPLNTMRNLPPVGQPAQADNAPRHGNGVPDYQDTIATPAPVQERVASEGSPIRPTVGRPGPL